MIVYQDTKKQFIDDVNLNQIVNKIYDEYRIEDKSVNAIITRKDMINILTGRHSSE